MKKTFALSIFACMFFGLTHTVYGEPSADNLHDMELVEITASHNLENSVWDITVTAKNLINKTDNVRVEGYFNSAPPVIQTIESIKFEQQKSTTFHVYDNSDSMTLNIHLLPPSNATDPHHVFDSASESILKGNLDASVKEIDDISAVTPISIKNISPKYGLEITSNITDELCSNIHIETYGMDAIDLNLNSTTNFIFNNDWKPSQVSLMCTDPHVKPTSILLPNAYASLDSGSLLDFIDFTMFQVDDNSCIVNPCEYIDVPSDTPSDVTQNNSEQPLTTSIPNSSQIFTLADIYLISIIVIPTSIAVFSILRRVVVSASTKRFNVTPIFIKTSNKIKEDNGS